MEKVPPRGEIRVRCITTADAFGNALGNAIVRAMKPQSQSEQVAEQMKGQRIADDGRWWQEQNDNLFDPSAYSLEKMLAGIELPGEPGDGASDLTKTVKLAEKVRGSGTIRPELISTDATPLLDKSSVSPYARGAIAASAIADANRTALLTTLKNALQKYDIDSDAIAATLKDVGKFDEKALNALNEAAASELDKLDMLKTGALEEGFYQTQALSVELEDGKVKIRQEVIGSVKGVLEDGKALQVGRLSQVIELEDAGASLGRIKGEVLVPNTRSKSGQLLDDGIGRTEKLERAVLEQIAEVEELTLARLAELDVNIENANFKRSLVIDTAHTRAGLGSKLGYALGGLGVGLSGIDILDTAGGVEIQVLEQTGNQDLADDFFWDEIQVGLADFGIAESIGVGVGAVGVGIAYVAGFTIGTPVLIGAAVIGGIAAAGYGFFGSNDVKDNFLRPVFYDQPFEVKKNK